MLFEMHECYTCVNFFFFCQVYTRVVYFVLSRETLILKVHLHVL